MSRLLWWIVGVPVGIVLVALAVANRKPVIVSLDPFNVAAPALALPVPLFLLVFGALILGVVLGGVAAWASQRGARRDRRLFRAEASRLRDERDRLRAEAEAQAARAVGTGLALPGPRRAA